jgi:hypothetical protein
MSGLSPGGIEWFYSPLPVVLPIVIAGYVAVPRAQKIPPQQVASNYDRAEAPFAFRPPCGLYVLLPLPGVTGASWPQAGYWRLLLVGAIGSNPFIYLQLGGREAPVFIGRQLLERGVCRRLQ